MSGQQQSQRRQTARHRRGKVRPHPRHRGVPKEATRSPPQLGRRSAIHVLWENVTGTTEEDAKYIAKSTGTKAPIELNAGVVSYATRPRLWWLTWILTLSARILGQRRTVASPEIMGKPPPRPPWHHTDYKALRPKLTCRMVPGSPDDKRGFRRNGLAEADAAQVKRWESDNKRLATYHYRADNLLWNSDKTAWRMPTPDEGDVLLGYPRGCTSAPGVLDYQREQMIGNTMHVQCVKRLLRDMPLDALAPTEPEDFELLGRRVQGRTSLRPWAREVAVSHNPTDQAALPRPTGR